MTVLRWRKTRIPALVVMALAVASCGGSSATGPIVIGNVGPFTGPEASFGGEITSGCATAALLIDRAGGVLGHKVVCKTVDSHGDAADGVPAVEQLIATTTNLVGVLGPTSGEATATAPLLNRANITMFAQSGEAAFDQTHFAYFWRLTPADDVAGDAMAVWAHHQGYTRAAAVFGNDVSAQGTVPTLFKAFTKKLGGTIAVNVSIVPAQSSYRSEVQRVLAAHPQVIFDETDPQSAATFFSELKQLNGRLIPAIGADPTLTPDWFAPVSKAIGKADVVKYISAEQGAAAVSGPTWQIWHTALLKTGSQVQNPGQWSTEPYSEHNYDAMNIMALAMIKANSIKPVDYNTDILAVTQPQTGKTVVNSYASGKAALAAGKQIQYVGVGGPALFDRFHNAPPRFDILRWDAQGNNVRVATLSSPQILAVR
jgi:ABC-type branched-subunit amino acid transport system substrate-binding protein